MYPTNDNNIVCGLCLLEPKHTSLMKVHYPKLYNMAHLSLNVVTASKGSNNYILFAITVAGVVPCGGPKKSPRTSSIVQIIFFF